MSIDPALRADLRHTALMLRLRAKADDPLTILELRQLADMLLNMSEERGALAPRWPALKTIKGGRDVL